MGAIQKEVELEEQELLKISEISIHIDTYDDIFSDFDSRSFSQRALSDDFLVEVKKAAKVKASGNLEVNFLIPKDMRNNEHESLIRKRLKEYFKKHHMLMHREIGRIRRKGALFVLIGMIFSLIAAYISSSVNVGSLNFLLHVALVLLEPAGWFTIWTGLERILSTREDKKEELEFYDRMMKAEFHFSSY